MKAITLRDIPAEIAAKIQKESERKGTSLNKTVIDLLAQAVGVANTKSCLYHDLDHLAGTWSKEEAETMDAALYGYRTIDAELWG